MAGFAVAPLLVTIATLIGLLIAPRWGDSAVDLLYLPAVIAVALFAGLGPALFAAIGATLAYNFFFTEPVHTLRIDSAADIVTVLILFGVALVVSQLAAQVRDKAESAVADAARNATIATTARAMLSCADEAAIAEVGVTHLSAIFDCNAILLENAAQPRVVAAAPGPATLNPSDVGAAAITLANGIPTGRGVGRVSTVEWQFHPVAAGDKPVAAIGLARNDGLPPIHSSERDLLANLLDQMALALERARLEGEARSASALRERDRLRSTLLASIGDELKPLVASIAQATRAVRRNPADRDALSVMAGDSNRLERFLDNLIELGATDDDRAPVVVGGIEIDLVRRVVRRDGSDIHLTPKEFAVLAELARHSGKVLGHAHLLRTAWGPAQEHQAEYLRVVIRALRQKLENDPSRPRLIVNQPAVGYRLATG